MRQSSIINEGDLQLDVGIYGSRAVGVQELGAHSRTVRFVLSFDYDRILDAESRWERIVLYATPYRELLEPEEFNI